MVHCTCRVCKGGFVVPKEELLEQGKDTNVGKEVNSVLEFKDKRTGEIILVKVAIDAQIKTGGDICNKCASIAASVLLKQWRKNAPRLDRTPGPVRLKEEL